MLLNIWRLSSLLLCLILHTWFRPAGASVVERGNHRRGPREDSSVFVGEEWGRRGALHSHSPGRWQEEWSEVTGVPRDTECPCAVPQMQPTWPVKLFLVRGWHEKWSWMRRTAYTEPVIKSCGKNFASLGIDYRVLVFEGLSNRSMWKSPIRKYEIQFHAFEHKLLSSILRPLMSTLWTKRKQVVTI